MLLATYIRGSHLSYEFPDGTPLFQDLEFSFGQKIYGLVGKNGTGKTTLLKLLCGDLKPTNGTLSVTGSIEILPQIHKGIAQGSKSETVADLLGVKTTLEALKRVSQGHDLLKSIEKIGLDWDLESRIKTTLCCLGIEQLDVHSPVQYLSGGELVKVYLARILLKSPSILLLDEPTNNLDQSGREVLYNFIKNWKKCMVVVSHDRELLSHVQTITELTHTGLRLYGGNYEFYLVERDKEIQALKQQLTAALRNREYEQADLQRSVERQQKRMVRGQEKAGQGGVPKILANGLKRRAQSTLSRVKGLQEDRLLRAEQEVRSLRAKTKESNRIQIDIPETRVPLRKELVEIRGFNFKFDRAKKFLFSENITFHLRGPARVSLMGGNGTGKSTLIRLLLKTLGNPTHELRGEIRGKIELKTHRVAYLDQNLEILGNGKESLLDQFSKMTPRLSVSERRIRLGRFLFHQENALKKIENLSGGERVRAALACVLFSEKPPELLILDEPTNNLDLDSIEQVESALSHFQGALIIVSHDREFLQNVETTEELKVSF